MIIKSIDNQFLYHDYVFGKQTLKQLSAKYKISVGTVQRKVRRVRSTRIISSEKSAVVLIETVYWGHNFGVVVIKDSRTNKILWRKFIHQKRPCQTIKMVWIGCWKTALLSMELLAMVCEECSKCLLSTKFRCANFIRLQ